MAKSLMTRSAWSAVVCLAAVVAAGCENSDGGGDPQVIDATSPASTVDGGVRDASVMDAQLADASRKEPRTCYSPLTIPAEGSALARQDKVQGCECLADDSTEYCLDRTAIICGQGTKAWQVVLDGPCFPARGPAPVGSCQKLGGASVARGATCPSGFATRYGYYRRSEDAGAGEYDDCCYPIEVPAQNCTAAGLKVQAAGTQSSLLGTSCGDAGVLRAFVVGQPAPSLCCAGTP